MIRSGITETVVCPQCHGRLVETDGVLVCSKCSKNYPIKGGIPDFRDKDLYWGNVAREKMKSLIRRAEETGDWLKSAREIVPEYAEHFIPFSRSDSQFLWPTNKDSVILDAGSMWGGLTVPAAQFHRHVYAVDKTIESLEFLKIRAAQIGLKNISAVATAVNSLPFPDNFFDLVILNGVLEWVGLKEDTILEQHWTGKREETEVYGEGPEEMQSVVLREALRVLKPTGSLFIAIENRYGIQYFLGYPDDHNNVRWVTFLPRAAASFISKMAGKGAYRTYVYSPAQLTRLVRRVGFSVSSMFGVFPHYIKVKKAYPLEMGPQFKSEIEIDSIVPKILHRIVRPFIPSSLTSVTSPSLFAICGKDANGSIPRIQSVLTKVNVIKPGADVRFVLSNNRFGNSNSANVIVYDGNRRPIFFCKIARDARCSGLETEARNLASLRENLKLSNDAKFRVPELIYFGVVDNLTILVTSYMNVKSAGLGWHFLVNKACDRLGLRNNLLRNAIDSLEERLFLKRMDKRIRPAIAALADFQKRTGCGTVNVKSALSGLVATYLKSEPKLSPAVNSSLASLQAAIEKLPQRDVLVCAVHGDYDFDNVLFSPDGRIALVDFEHVEKQGLPFFDLALLIFNPLLMKWERSRHKDGSFAKYLNDCGAMDYIADWLELFCDFHALPHSLVPVIPLAAAVEQNTKSYPEFRNPDTYPMYGVDIVLEFQSIRFKRQY
jgi:SAM-dependent methyltransferase